MPTTRASIRFDQDGEPQIEFAAGTIPEPETDWAALAALTDDQILAAAQADPDAQPLSQERLARLRPLNEARRVRHRLGLTQVEFAEQYSIPLGTLRDWEQFRRRPDATGLILLRTVLRDPDLVARAVADLRADGSLPGPRGVQTAESAAE